MTKAPRVIKRYTNRKLYDTLESRYVTLEQLAELIRTGEEVSVLDNTSKEDLTAVTLAQIIFEEERRRSFVPLATLRRIIQSSEESFHELVGKIEQSAGRVGRVFRREDSPAALPAEGSADAAFATPAATQERAEPAASAPEPAARAESGRTVRELIENIQHTIDEWHKRVDANVHSALESVSPLVPLQRELHALNERLGQLEARLARVEGSEMEPPAVAVPSDEGPG